jgi:hypothetical protein
MADLTADDITITVQTNIGLNPYVHGPKRYSSVKVTFGDGAKTYPADGVPLPTYEKWGLTRNIETVFLDDPGSPSAYTHKYDRANNKLRMYHAGAELASGVDAPAAQTLYAIAVGW